MKVTGVCLTPGSLLFHYSHPYHSGRNHVLQSSWLALPSQVLRKELYGRQASRKVTQTYTHVMEDRGTVCANNPIPKSFSNSFNFKKQFAGIC